MMIKVNIHKQVGLPDKKMVYSWEGRVLKITLLPQNITEVFDLSALRPGDEVYEIETENLPFSPLIRAKVLEDNTLVVDLVFWVDSFHEEIPETLILEE
jgi:hypothetical protein